MAKENEKVMENVEETKTEAPEENEVVDTTAETLAATPVVPMKVKVGNFVYKHRTAIVGIVTGAVGLAAGLIAGGKAGFAAGKQAGIDAATPAQIPTADVPEAIDIPQDVNIEV